MSLSYQNILTIFLRSRKELKSTERYANMASKVASSKLPDDKANADLFQMRIVQEVNKNIVLVSLLQIQTVRRFREFCAEMVRGSKCAEKP